MKRWLPGVGHWFEARLQLKDSLWPVLRHPVPRGLGWWYVFGSATLTMFVLQVVTGVCLTFFYVPSGGEAYASLEYMNYRVLFGWLLRAMHFWAASGMVVLMALHMTRVFLLGAFKYPRELTWIIGVVLMVLTLGLAFSGQVLRWDQDAYWGLAVGMSMLGRFPNIGAGLSRLSLGGPILGSDSLSRFFSLHVFWLPGLLMAFLTVHLYLVVKQGISAFPVPGRPVRKQTYQGEYDKELRAGEPFYPRDFVKDAVFSAVCVLVVMLLALVLGPRGPGGVPDPSLIHTEPRPDWEFRWLFALLALSPPEVEALVMLALPPVLVIILLLVPFLAGTGERHPSRRPVAVLSVVLIYLTFGVLTWLGYKSPWSPRMTAWSRDPVPVPVLTGLLKEAGAEGDIQNYALRRLQGAVVFQYKSCRNCHSLGGLGGERGPDLDGVGSRLTRDELVRQVLQGGGNMPAYGKQLTPAEVEALVAFLHALRPPGERPAHPTAPGEGTKPQP